MNTLKKIARLLLLICMVFLASIGIGIGGAVPLNNKKRDESNDTDIKIELIETKTEKQEKKNFKV